MKPIYLIKVRRRKGMIDLTHIGHEEQMLSAVANKDEWFEEKFQEAVIVGELEDLFIPPPTLTPTEKSAMWKKIISAINPRQFLP